MFKSIIRGAFVETFSNERHYLTIYLLWLRMLKMKNDHRSNFSNFNNWKEEAWKNQGLEFFRLLLSSCLNWKNYCDDHSSLWSTTAVQIYELFHIYFTSIELCIYIMILPIARGEVGGLVPRIMFWILWFHWHRFDKHFINPPPSQLPPLSGAVVILVL